MNKFENILIDAKKRLLRMHYEAGVGHIGGNLSCLDAMLLVFHSFLSQSDKFILSKGHSAGALYVSLWSAGYLGDEDLKTFHGEGTYLPAHPPISRFEKIPFSTGSLGHGLSLAVGVALAKKLRGDDGHIFCMTSDGEWQEGSTWEALIFLNHHQLKNITVLVDHNRLQGFGTTGSVASMSSISQRLQGFDLDVTVINGHDPELIYKNIKRSVDNKETVGPCIIILETVKGKGVSFMENKMEWHYLPLDDDSYRVAIEEVSLGLENEN